MEHSEYVDFRLKIGPRVGDNRYAVSASCDVAGDASDIFDLPFDETELENFVLKVGLTRRGARSIGSLQWKRARSFGETLFRAVFMREVRDCFATSRNKAQREGKALRIKLTLDEGELINYPWEYLYDPSLKRFLTLYEKTPLVRYVELPVRVPSLEVKLPLRILVMASSPRDYPTLDLEGERRNLDEALRDLRGSESIIVDWLEEANLQALHSRLLGRSYHILHFIGHGRFDEEEKDGQLMMTGAGGYGELVSGERLAVLLGSHDLLRLVVLNACEGARTSSEDPFAGAATTLMRTGGVPAVVAMQFEITDDAAIAFARGFYSALTAGRPVDAAVTQARLAIFAQDNDVEWGTPVLYMRSPDGVLFDVKGGETANKEEELSLPLSAPEPQLQPSSAPSPLTEPKPPRIGAVLVLLRNFLTRARDRIPSKLSWMWVGLLVLLVVVVAVLGLYLDDIFSGIVQRSSRPTLVQPTAQINVETFYISREGNSTEGKSTIVVEPDTAIAATAEEILHVEIEFSRTDQAQEEDLLFSWYTCHEGDLPVVQRIGNSHMLYVAPSELGSDCIRVIVEKDGIQMDEGKIFVNVQNP